jgi:hypothetical protein
MGKLWSFSHATYQAVCIARRDAEVEAEVKSESLATQISAAGRVVSLHQVT